MRLLLAVSLLLCGACDLGSVLPEGEGGEPGQPGDNGPDTGNGVAYHPTGFGSPDMHGLEFNLQDQDCRSCHGTDLTGGLTAPSCDTCHSATEPQAWRSDCTFCHGATPKNLDNSQAGGFFLAHQVHLGTTMMSAVSCEGCHNKPTDVLTEGHAFDITPGAAEVVLVASNAQGSFAAGTCSNLYCHGNGRADNGTIAITAPTMTCEGCHAGPDGGSAAWGTMSGEHRKHLDITGVTCADCHLGVTTDGRTLANPALHIDGLNQTASADLTIQAGATVRCTGACHGDNHNNESW